MAEPLVLAAVQLIVSPIINHVIARIYDAEKKEKELREEADKEKNKLDKEAEKEREKLVKKLKIIRGVLLDAESRQQNEAVRSWLEELKEVMCDAEDVLDEYNTDLAMRISNTDATRISSTDAATGINNKRKSEVSRSAFLRCCFTGTTCKDYDSKTEQPKQSETANEIRKINERLGDLEETRMGLGLKVLDATVQDTPTPIPEWRQTTPTIGLQPLGRDSLKLEITEKIIQAAGSAEGQEEGTSHCSNKTGGVSVLPIIGMGGIGKTTLAKTIFDDDKIKKFDLRVWVCVSEDFRITRIITEMINYIYQMQGRQEPTKWTNLLQLERELVELMGEKRVFIVLDDVWNDELRAWEQLLDPFMAAGKKGARIAILITTRLATIEKGVHISMKPVWLQVLVEEEMWEVLKLYAFDINNSLEDNMRRTLEPIGRSIVKSLKGLPLAAKSIGSLLATDYSVKHWKKILASDLLRLEQKDNAIPIIPILRLSYDHLPSHLKQCLLYFSLFPKDYEYQEYEVIHLWMAHNAILCDRVEEVEDTGKQYIYTLVCRSFLELHEESNHPYYPEEFYYGPSIKRYKMHDLIHDLVRWILYEVAYPKGIRHLSFCNCDRHLIDDVNRMEEVAKLRTWMHVGYGEYLHSGIAEHLSSHMKRLRALFLRRCGIEWLPESVGNLKHLRLLDLSGNYGMKGLPESIGSLYNLQVLNLGFHNREFEFVPSSLTMLVNLSR